VVAVVECLVAAAAEWRTPATNTHSPSARRLWIYSTTSTWGRRQARWLQLPAAQPQGCAVRAADLASRPVLREGCSHHRRAPRHGESSSRPHSRS